MTSARQIAFNILNLTQEGRHTLDHWLEKAETRINLLNKPDRALVHTLVYGTLRWQGRLDFIIDQLTQKSRRIDPQVRTILRLGLFQLHHLDRVPVSAAVNTSVNLAKHNHRSWAAGFVNGLLRRASRDAAAIHWPDWNRSPYDALAARQSLPHWLAGRWIKRWGLEDARQMADRINTIPTITLRVNTLKTTREQLIQTITSDTQSCTPTPHSPDGVRLGSSSGRLVQWPAFDQGLFQIQDEAAQLVSRCLTPRPDDTVWDACTGLGTKAAHLAQLMGNRGRIMASDVSAQKIERLSAEMGRLGITNVTGRTLDLLKHDLPSDLPLFDAILLDAPCSGLGVLQKNPDGKWRTRPQDLMRCHDRQIKMLEQVSRYLRPGGRLVYAVCSFEPEENELVLKAFLQKHPEFAIDTARLEAATQPEKLISKEGWLTTLPHRHGMDGFFAALLVKKA